MKKLTGNEKVAFGIAGVMFLLFVGAAVLTGILLHMLDGTEQDFSDYRTKTEIELSELEKEKNKNGASLSDLKQQLALAEKNKSELENRIGQAESELKKLENSFADKDELYGTLNAELAALQQALAEKQTEIDALKDDIRGLEQIYSVDLNRQMEILAKLELLLTEGAPMNKVETPLLNEDGTPMLGDDGLPAVEVNYVYPKIAVYYEDIGRGYHYGWNETQSFYSASCVKAPFALSILQAASKEKAEYDLLLAEYIAQNGPVEALPDYEWKYDFNKIFTYTKEGYQSGSGVIKNEEYGVQYTYYELFEKMLRYSDNVAFHELKECYGTSLLKTLAKEMGTKAMKNNVYQATAADLGKSMKAIYRFIESEDTYAPLMRDAMKSSIHTVTIGYGVSPKKIAHKYGWDTEAYHDMAIVYDEHPYVLVFMSDMDTGGNEVNAYIQKVVGLIDDLHENFYQ